MLLQALTYREAGWGSMEPFISTALAGLRTRSGRRLGEAAQRVNPAHWWQSFARRVPPVEPPSGNGS
jgi:hypothetical protein